jgi:hypothetical protein
MPEEERRQTCGYECTSLDYNWNNISVRQLRVSVYRLLGHVKSEPGQNLNKKMQFFRAQNRKGMFGDICSGSSGIPTRVQIKSQYPGVQMQWTKGAANVAHGQIMCLATKRLFETKNKEVNTA